MTRFYFDVNNNGMWADDQFGVELEGVDEVGDQAVAILVDVVKDALPKCDQHEFVCEARTEHGGVIYRARLSLNAGRVDDR